MPTKKTAKVKKTETGHTPQSVCVGELVVAGNDFQNQKLLSISNVGARGGNRMRVKIMV